MNTINIKIKYGVSYMLKIKKTIAILLTVCFLVSITAVAASAGHGHQKQEVNKEVIATLKTVEADGGNWELHLIKCTIETHHGEKVWFETKWEFVSDEDEDEDE